MVISRFGTAAGIGLLLAAHACAQEYQRLYNTQAGFLNNNEKDRGGTLQVTPVGDGWWSAMWVLESMSEPNVPAESKVYQIKNRWTGEYLVADVGEPPNLVAGASGPASWWKRRVLGFISDGNGGPSTAFYTLQNVKSNRYLAVNQGRHDVRMIDAHQGAVSTWVLDSVDSPSIKRDLLSSIPAPAVTKTVELTAEDRVIMRDLGRGYNATGSYANERYLLKPIFALDGRRHYEFTPMAGTSQIFTKSGSSAMEFSKRLAVNVEGGISGLFSATIKAGVERSASGSAGTSFAQVDDTLVLYTARLSPSAHPTPEALNDLNNMDPAEVIAQYGTHYTNFLEFGGHLTLVTFLEQRERSNALSITAEAEAAYGIVRGKAGMESNTSTTARSMSQRGQFFCSGGYCNLNELTQMNDKLYTSWKDSVSENPGLAGFGPDTVTDGLRGIWTVPGLNPERSAVLRSAVTAYIQRRGEGAFDKPGVQPVKKNQNFTIQGENGLYLGRGTVSQNYWYATMGANGPQVHNFGVNGEPLLSGHVVKLVTANPDSRYPQYNRLMAPKSGYTCYYSFDNGDYEDWYIWKDGKDLHAGEPIYYGDTVVIENSSYRNQFLRPYNAPWLGVGDAFKWILRQP